MVNIEKFNISRDPQLYHAWPDVVLALDGTLICVFNECTHHLHREYSCIVQSVSTDRGRTWSPKQQVTPVMENDVWYYNCPRISRLRDGRLALIVDRIPAAGGESRDFEAVSELRFSSDCGKSWSTPIDLPLRGIVPDKLCELDTGRWLISAHRRFQETSAQFLRYSDDGGKSWSNEILVASSPQTYLCEVSLLPLGNNIIVAFMRDNTNCGNDCKKTISFDGGESWGAIIDFPLPGCHRPVSGMLHDGRIFITYRFLQGGGNGKFGLGTQNFFGALTDRDSVLADTRQAAAVRIIPIDFDRAVKADLGYSGWAEFPDGEVYIVSYIVDDAIDKGQIRGYSIPGFKPFMLS